MFNRDAVDERVDNASGKDDGQQKQALTKQDVHGRQDTRSFAGTGPVAGSRSLPRMRKCIRPGPSSEFSAL